MGVMTMQVKHFIPVNPSLKGLSHEIVLDLMKYCGKVSQKCK
jgi:hypothetical protein